MSTAVLDRPAAARAQNGGVPARRAVVRWGLRLFRREWRQQLLVLALLAVAVAATTMGLAVATNATASAQTTLRLRGDDPSLDADLAAIRASFGSVDVFEHVSVAVPGTVSAVDVRARLAADAAESNATLRLVGGRLPVGEGEVAMTRGVAALLDVSIGGAWDAAGRSLHVVGLVENPKDLHDAFALVAPGQVGQPDSISATFGSVPDNRLRQFRLPSRRPLQIEAESATAKSAAAIAVLALGAIGLLFVGLVGVAGFSVMAQRRSRALGMLGSIGATDSHIRLVLLANGAAVGAGAAVAGSAVGLIGWLLYQPSLETIAGHRMGRFDVPWPAVAAAMGLAVATAVAASWWPARAATRTSVVTALSGRPPRPRPAVRFAALGAALLAAGITCLALSHQRRPLLAVAGAVATVLGVLLAAPLAIRALAAVAGRAPIAVRLALRDLARYQARSGAALGAATLAVGIAATIAVTASAQQAEQSGSQANLAANDLVVYLSPAGGNGLVPDLDAARVDEAKAQVDALASSMGARDPVELDRAVNLDAPKVDGPGRTGRESAAFVEVTPQGRGESIRLVAPLYVATAAVLERYRIDPSAVDPTADVLSNRTDLTGLQLGYGPRSEERHPKIQRVPGLPRGSAEPNALITPATVARLGLQQAPSAWLVSTARPLTTAQIASARKAAAAAGLTIETRDAHDSLAQLGTEVTAVGVLLALGVLAMTVGLIRSETANDLRILAATGASSTTRRNITAATTGGLALLAVLLGTAEAHAALLAFYRSHLHLLRHPPVADLAVIIVGLPVVAVAAGWLLAGREPPALARRPLE